MNLIRVAIDRPIAVIAGVILVVMFGVIALQTIPIQLIPDVRKPVIEVETNWPGAAPAEVEREIVNRQEEALRGLQGLETLESTSETGRGRITLHFRVGQNMDQALLLVSNRLDQVNGYPDEADEPSLKTSSSEDNAIAWFIVVREPGNDEPIHTFFDFIEDTVSERLERVPGVASTRIYGGAERQLQITVQPERMAHYGLTIGEIVGRLRAANASMSAGDVDEGKRTYVVRTEGELTSPAAVGAVVLRSLTDPDTGRVARVTVADVADIAFGYDKPRATIRRLGSAAIGVPLYRETGANVIETMEGIRAAVADLNRDLLPRARLRLIQTYDETVYIDSAIDLVRQNIVVGGLLAAGLLLLFLRSWRPTLIVSIAIPVSVIGSFVAMAALGRSINVISLAGIAFAVGMVVDAAIVVLENIYRLRESGRSPRDAAYEGANQVWGAILVSALTTVMVFIPLLVMDLEVGQLFRDIAVAISVSVCLSLLVAITMIPALAQSLLTRPVAEKPIRIPGVDHFARWFARGVVGYVRLVLRRKTAAIGSVAIITAVATAATVLLLPKLDYLPDGNRNLIIGYMIPPPGYNLDTMTEIASRVEDRVRPLWVSETGPEPTADGTPKIEDFYFVALPSLTLVIARSADPARVKDLIPAMSAPVFQEPGTIGFFRNASLFGRGIGGSRAIDLNVSGPELNDIVSVAQRAAGKVEAALPRADGHQMRPLPDLTLGAPEVRLTPNRARLADAGVSAVELGQTVDVFNDGLRVAEVTVGAKRLDLMLRGPSEEILRTQGINYLPVVTGDGMILPASELARIEVTSGPTQIRHNERLRTITLQISPRADLPLEEAMDLIRSQVLQPLAAEGLPPGVKFSLEGSASELAKTWDHMSVDLVLAVVIVFLVMAVLFESFVYPLVILVSVPVAAAGAVAGLAILNLFTLQNLDMLTLLGFIILIGIVVNNAILLVHQSLFHIRQEGMGVTDGIIEATSNRIRPIFMSTLTSIFGMAPLVIFPGAGSELYRGLGSVVLGGLSLSAVLTLLVVPPLMAVVVGPLERRRTAQAAALSKHGEAPRVRPAE
ncbi:MAG: efflux RND transporter permease subunit [Alphaproteobacteria bacterium]|nr:efflux RND transporter permease subunit [Alphaproteobacteria bacterium]MCB9928383.1 efflux RND transporter permease subunit [Alphaproteobacteria bacterium]